MSERDNVINVMTLNTFIIALISYLPWEGLCFEMQLLKTAFQYIMAILILMSP